MDQSNHTIGFIGDREIAAQALGLPVILLRRDDQVCDTEVDAVVVDVRAFDSIAQYREFCQRLTCPILHLSDPALLADVIGDLPDKDDVCLVPAPVDLLSIRIRKLLSGADESVDRLTGVLDRSRWISTVARLAENACDDAPTSVILLDLDHFKTINDRYGHQFGDDVLRSVGRLLQENCRQRESAGRYGGEEFGILLSVAEAEAVKIAEKYRQNVSREDFGECQILTASVGVATTRQSCDAQTLLAQADEALYAAKAQGRNRTLHHNQLRDELLREGEDLAVVGLEHRARVLTERVTNYIAQRSRKILRQVSEESQTDGLTGFHTRRHLDRRLQAEFGDTHDRPLAIALLDVDHFGQINKIHGWPTGDKILREVCDRIRQHVRDSDWVGRYGGEEFCIVMPDTTIPQASTVLQRLRAAVAESPFETTSGQQIDVTVSIGAAQRRADDSTAAETLERASDQTLTAKRDGRNRLCVSE